MSQGWMVGPFYGTPAQVTALVTAATVPGGQASHFNLCQTFLNSELALLKSGTQCKLTASGNNGLDGGSTATGAGSRRQFDYEIIGTMA